MLCKRVQIKTGSPFHVFQMTCNTPEAPSQLAHPVGIPSFPPFKTPTDKAWTMIWSGEVGAVAAVRVTVGLVVSVKGSPWFELVWSK